MKPSNDTEAGNKDNIVRVDFAAMGRARRQERDSAFQNGRGQTYDPLNLSASIHRLAGPKWLDRIDAQAPWLIRLMAVILVVALSLLIL